MPVSKTYLRRILLTHPDYPSLLSITDTLERLQIPNAAVVVDKSKWNELPTPCLAYLEKDSGYYELIKEKELLREDGALYKDWSGIVIAAEKPDSAGHPENIQALRQDRRQQYLWGALVLLLLSMSVLAVLHYLTAAVVVLFVSALAGIGISTLIVQQELGVETGVSHAFCDMGKGWDCSSLIGDEKAKLLGAVGWSDIGMIYFTGQWMAFVAASVGNVLPGVLLLDRWLAFGSLPFIGYSLYYQARVAKKWCPLCLTMLAILVVQFAMLMSFNGYGPDGTSVMVMAASLGLTAVVWLLVKGLMKEKVTLDEEWATQMRFRKNPDIFLAVLGQQRRVDITPFAHELEMSSHDAPIKITVACGPYCGPCARGHEVLDALIDMYGDKISIAVRFAIQDVDEGRMMGQAVRYILGQAAGGDGSSSGPGRVKKVLHDWYTQMDLSAFKLAYPQGGDVDVSRQVREHLEWTKQSQITHTPTIFINGLELPKPYSATDLPLLLPFVSESVLAPALSTTAV